MSRGFVLPALVLALTVGCSGQESVEDEPVVPTPSQAAETDSALPSEQEAVDVYRQFWDAIVVAAMEPDPDAPELEEFAVGQALELARFALEGVRDSGRGMEGDLVMNPEVVAITKERDGHPVEVAIEDCQSAQDFRLAGDEPGDQEDVLVTATVRHDLFDWWVVEMRIWGEDEC